ncbi:MAG: glycosyltransferase [Bacteroidales bacterium]|nr:glycosyltransferase [Bacteroidales bacterium]
MKKLFIDLSPGFYKTKLLNELSKKINLLVIYTTGYDATSRNDDFLKGQRNYPYIQLSGSKCSQCYQIIKSMISGGFDEIIVGGYVSLASWMPILFSSKKRNAMLLESTFRETKIKGAAVIMKKFFFSRLHRVYVCGSPHEKLTRMFGFKGECKYWHSVGLINLVSQPAYAPRTIVRNFLFVGRLIWQKNLMWLIDRFTEHPELNLTIVGFGELEGQLKSHICSPNINMVGAINNEDLAEYYQYADVFILPSVSETWGLVVEEALNNGTPVMLSHMVGAADDLAIPDKTGVIFQSNDIESFEMKLKEICDLNRYNGMRKYISKMNFEEREDNIIKAFVD